jgi:hypothetical protein
MKALSLAQIAPKETCARRIDARLREPAALPSSRFGGPSGIV